MTTITEQFKDGLQKLSHLSNEVLENVDSWVSQTLSDFGIVVNPWDHMRGAGSGLSTSNQGLEPSKNQKAFIDLSDFVVFSKGRAGSIAAQEKGELRAARRFLADELGSTIEKKITNENIVPLVSLIKEGEKTAELALRIVKGVARGQQSELMINDVIQRLSQHNGSLPVLRAFLDIFQTDNPYELCKRMQYRIPRPDEIPDESKRDLGATSELAPSREGVRGVHGGVLRIERVIHVFDPKDPDCPGLHCGRQALARVGQTFAPEKFDGIEEPARRATDPRVSNRVKLARELIESLSVEDLENDPELVRRVGSNLIARELQLYKELRALVESYKLKLDQELFGAELHGMVGDRLRVRSDPGGQLWTWFERQLNDRDAHGNSRLPEAVEVAYCRLRDPACELTKKEERLITSALLAYYKQNSYVARDTAFKEIENDIEALRKLPETDPLRIKYLHNVEVGLAEKRGILSTHTGDISYSQLNEVLFSIPVQGFRSEMNERSLAPYRKEFESAVDRFRILFQQEGGAFFEEAIGSSVPMKMLSESLYGTKIAKRGAGSEEKALFTREEFGALRDAVMLKTLARNESQLLGAMDVESFKEMVERIIVANRKADYLEGILAKAKMTIEDRRNVGDALEGFSAVLPTGTDWQPLEKLSGKTGLSHDELFRRIDLRILTDQYVRTPGNCYQVEREAKLFDIESAPALTKLFSSAGALTPESEVELSKQAAAQAKANPLVQHSGYDVSVALSKQHYFTQKEIELFKTGATLAELFKQWGMDDVSVAGKVKNEIVALRSAQLLSGGIKDKRVQIDQNSLSTAVEMVTKKAESFTYLSVPAYEAMKGQLHKDSIQLQSLPEGEWRPWVAKAKYLCSYASQSRLLAAGYEPAHESTFRRMAQFIPTQATWVSRDLFQAIKDFPLEISEQRPLVQRPLPRQFAWSGEEITLNWGKEHKGSTLEELRLSSRGRDYLGFMIRNQEKFNLSPIAVEILQEVLKPLYRGENAKNINAWVKNNFR